MVAGHTGPGERQRVQRRAGRRQEVHVVIGQVTEEHRQVQVFPFPELAINGPARIGEFGFIVHLRVADKGDAETLRLQRERRREQKEEAKLSHRPKVMLIRSAAWLAFLSLTSPIFPKRQTTPTRKCRPSDSE